MDKSRDTGNDIFSMKELDGFITHCKSEIETTISDLELLNEKLAGLLKEKREWMPGPG